MRKLIIPECMKEEFSTVESLWISNAKTKRVDALILTWVKYEKQLRRLFSFLVFQHPAITSEKIDSIISVLVKNRKLYPETFVALIKELGVKSIPQLVAERYDYLSKEITRIKGYRNKLMHGQITGENISSAQLEKDVTILVEWISTIASAAENEFGYDGMQRNTYSKAKSTSKIAIENYPFGNAADLKSWLNKLTG